jgi:hypothetical protein
MGLKVTAFKSLIRLLKPQKPSRSGTHSGRKPTYGRPLSLSMGAMVASVTLSTYFGTYFIYLPLGNALRGPVTDVTPASVPKVLLNLYLRWNPTFHLDIKEITSCLTPNHQKIVLWCSSLAS